jgi:microcystin degradation protein MlrC
VALENSKSMVRPPRILVVGLKQESSTFNPLKSSLSDFEIYRGDTAIASMRETLTEFAGIINTAGQCKLELKFGLIAWAPSGGIVEDHTWKTLSQEILTDLATTDCDGVIAVLHG